MIYKYGIDFGTTNSSIAMRFVGDDKEEPHWLLMLRIHFQGKLCPQLFL